MTHTDNERRRAIIEYAEPAPQSPNGLCINLGIALYDSDGHSCIAPVDSTERHAVINCPDDLELIAQFAKLIARLRRQQKQQRADG